MPFGVAHARDDRKHAGFMEAERRVKELAIRYPHGTPSAAGCAKAAAHKAMAVVSGWAALSGFS